MAGRRSGDAPAAAAAGVASAVLGAGLGELVAAWAAPAASPFAAIGDALIDLAPPWAKDTAIALFGTNDKLALLVGIALVLLAVAAAAGIAELLWPPSGRAVFVLMGAAGIVAAATRPDASGLAWLPSTVAGGVAAIALGMLLRRIPGASRVPAPTAGAGASRTPAATGGHATTDVPGPLPWTGPTRRRFLAWAGTAALVGIVTATGGALVQTGARVASTARRALRLPAPAATAAPIPAGAALTIPGLTPLVTPNADFYRIDTALIVPEVDPTTWTLRVHGMVERPFTLTWEQLLALSLAESWTTLTCVSNVVGGDLVGNAKWLGHPIRDILARARPHPDADMVLSRSVDGFTASTPLEVLTDGRDAILAVGMNDEPLPLAHGFPVRMVVPGLYGYVSATKWVTDLEVTRFDRAEAYWTTRGWSPRGPIKLESRIDVPRGDRPPAAGDTVIAGVAWQQHVGVSKVEVSVDDGPWRRASLASAISDDTWVQWSIPWRAERGDHRIRCRATNSTGQVQTAQDAPPAPDGATGWDEVRVSIS